LTVAGIGVGIGSILFLVSLGYGVQKVVLEKIATSDSLLSLDVSTGSKEKLITNKDIEKLKNIDDISKLSPVINQKVKISGNDFVTDSNINIVNNNFFSLEGISADVGDVFDEGESGKVVVTQAILDLLHIDNFEEHSVTVSIESPQKENAGPAKVVEKTYGIKGVIENTSKPNLYIPASSVSEVGFNSFSRIKIKVSSDNQLDPVRNVLINNGYFVAAVSDTVDHTRKIFGVIQLVLLSFGMIALTVSAIGMFNTMTISLLERTQEIAIMKSLGASAKDIWSMFLAESVLIGFAGGVTGIIIGYTTSEIFNSLLNFLATRFGGTSVDIFYIPIWFLFFIISFSTIVGLITGFYPARRAVNLDTLDALVYK